MGHLRALQRVVLEGKTWREGGTLDMWASSSAIIRSVDFPKYSNFLNSSFLIYRISLMCQLRDDRAKRSSGLFFNGTTQKRHSWLATPDLLVITFLCASSVRSTFDLGQY